MRRSEHGHFTITVAISVPISTEASSAALVVLPENEHEELARFPYPSGFERRVQEVLKKLSDPQHPKAHSQAGARMESHGFRPLLCGCDTLRSPGGPG
jgi:hypothetical protein